MADEVERERARERSERALRRVWAQEPSERPESYNRYCIEFDCSYETFLELLHKVASYPTVNRKYRMMPREVGTRGQVDQARL